MKIMEIATVKAQGTTRRTGHYNGDVIRFLLLFICIFNCWYYYCYYHCCFDNALAPVITAASTFVTAVFFSTSVVAVAGDVSHQPSLFPIQ